jgi:hypothetical protein
VRTTRALPDDWGRHWKRPRGRNETITVLRPKPRTLSAVPNQDRCKIRPQSATGPDAMAEGSGRWLGKKQSLLQLWGYALTMNRARSPHAVMNLYGGFHENGRICIDQTTFPINQGTGVQRTHDKPIKKTTTTTTTDNST